MTRIHALSAGIVIALLAGSGCSSMGGDRSDGSTSSSTGSSGTTNSGTDQGSKPGTTGTMNCDDSSQPKDPNCPATPDSQPR